MLSQRFTNQAVLSVHQQPAPCQAAGRPPYRGHRQSHPSNQQPYRGHRPSYPYNQQRKNGTKPFESQYKSKKRERLEIERLEGEIMQLSDIVKVVVGDIVRLTEYVGAQFNLRPVMGNPPFGQVSQVHQGVQSQGVGITGVQYPPPVHHHTLYDMGGDRAQSYASNTLYVEQPYDVYAADDNKDASMFVNGERERGRWGVEHDTPHAPNHVGHDAWHAYSDPNHHEYENYDDCYEGEGYDDEYGYDHDDSAYVHDDSLVRRSSETASAITHMFIGKAYRHASPQRNIRRGKPPIGLFQTPYQFTIQANEGTSPPSGGLR